MANQYNENLNFENAGTLQALVAQYEDPRGNLWRITAVGQEQVIGYLQENRGILLVAEPANEPRSLPEAERREYQGEGEPAGEEPAISELEVTIELIHLRVEPPYRISFLIDPPLGPNAVQIHTINIANDTQTTASFSADYQVNVRLYKTNWRNPCSNASGISGSVSCSGTNYKIRVRNNTGNQNDYTLSGDINLS
jgi:hypothetical protein